MTHVFYRYPARFSPSFARAAIEAFTSPGELVLDPFMGGGTTLVEARVLGRLAIGADISHLAHFISQVKVSPLLPAEVRSLRRWIGNTGPALNVQTPASPIEGPAPANLDTRETWRIRKLISLAIECVDDLGSARSRAFARCLILKTAQWALDGRRRIPTVPEFRAELQVNLDLMLRGMDEFRVAVMEADRSYSGHPPGRAWCIVAAAADLHQHRIWRHMPKPKLILTSPPYAGVHVVYDRWQITGRRETSAPFWIANSVDGQCTSHYTFGDRRNEAKYFSRAHDAFAGLARLAAPDTLLVQLVGFARPERQLPTFLEVLESAGFEEVDIGPSNRLWRQVPNRKWHADQKGETASSKEVVLIHRLLR